MTVSKKSNERAQEFLPLASSEQTSRYLKLPLELRVEIAKAQKEPIDVIALKQYDEPLRENLSTSRSFWKQHSLQHGLNRSVASFGRTSGEQSNARQAWEAQLQLHGSLVEEVYNASHSTFIDAWDNSVEPLLDVARALRRFFKEAEQENFSPAIYNLSLAYQDAAAAKLSVPPRFIAPLCVNLPDTY